MTLLVALMKVFKREGQNIADFKAEAEKLSDADRAWFLDRFQREHPEMNVTA